MQYAKRYKLWLVTFRIWELTLKPCTNLLSKNLHCVKCEQFYQGFASLPLGLSLLPRPLTDPTLAQPLCFQLRNHALMPPPLSSAPVCVITRVHTFPCCLLLPTHLSGPSWMALTPRGPVVSETSFSTADPQGYPVLTHMTCFSC